MGTPILQFPIGSELMLLILLPLLSGLLGNALRLFAILCDTLLAVGGKYLGWHPVLSPLRDHSRTPLVSMLAESMRLWRLGLHPQHLSADTIRGLCPCCLSCLKSLAPHPNRTLKDSDQWDARRFLRVPPNSISRNLCHHDGLLKFH